MIFAKMNSEDLRKHYDYAARFYDISDWFFETFRYKKIRPVVWSYARGKTLDLGTGTGRNIPYYPSTCSEVIGADLSGEMLNRAKERAASLNVSVPFYQMDATDLNLENGSYDTIVATFLFCVLPKESQLKALSECWRVLKTGGRIVFLEYTYSQNFFRRLWMKILSPYVYILYKAGFDRNTVQLLKQENIWKFEVDRFLYKDIIRLVVVQKI